MTLAEYEAAPEWVRDAFDSACAEQARIETEQKRWEMDLHPDDPEFSPHNPRLAPAVRWDDTWRRRARRPLRSVESDPRLALAALDLRNEWERLTGEEVPTHGMVACPVPEHEDRHPSCSVREIRWRCFSCGANGTVIDLAAVVFDIEPYGRGFFELRERLLEAA